MSAPPAPPTVPGPVPAAAVRALLERHRRIKPADVFYRLYVIALFATPAGALASQPGGMPVASPDASALLDGLLVWTPVAILAAGVAIGRLAAWAGIVVPDEGEVAWVLTAPIRRTELLRARVVHAVLTAGVAGGLVGYAPALLLAIELDHPTAPILAAGAGVGVALGVVAAGGVWWLQASSRRARLAVRAGPWVLALACAAGAAAHAWPIARELLAWSGPWGWAPRVVAAAAGAPTAGGGAAGALLALTAAGVGILTIRRADAVPLAEHARRAPAFSGVRSALFGADVRFAASLRREALRGLLGVPRRRLPRPRTPSLVVPWADALGLLRAPRWLATGAVASLALHVAGAATRTQDLGLPGLLPLAIGLVGAQAAATQVLDGLRGEHESLVGERYLPWSPHRTIALHLVAPAVALLVVIGVAATVTLALGTAAPGTVGWAVLGAAIAVPVLLGGATLSATAPPLEPGALLAGGEAGLTLTLNRLFLGPQLSAVLVLLPAMVVLATASIDAPVGGALAGAAAWSLAASGAIAAGLRRRLRRLDA